MSATNNASTNTTRMSLRSSLRSSADSRTAQNYIHRLAVLYDDQHTRDPCDCDQQRLRHALQEAGQHAEGIGAVEVYRYRERLGDLEWLDMWRTNDPGAKEAEDDDATDVTKPDPVLPGTGLVGTIWSSQTVTKRQQSRSISSSQPNATSTEQPVDASTAPTELEAIAKNASLAWRDLKSIDMDPDTWHCSRVQEHLQLGLAKASGVCFASDGVKGVVIYYAEQSVDKDTLNALTNTIYLKRCAAYIGSLVAMSEARRACLSYREAHAAVGKKKKKDKDDDKPDKTDEETPPVASDQTEKLESFQDDGTSSCLANVITRVVAWYNKCWGGGLQIPPPMELQQVCWTWLGAFCGLLTLSVINELVVHLSDNEYQLVLGPFGAMMTLLYALPSAPASQPRNVILGEAIAGAVSMALSYLPLPKWARRAVTPAFGIAAMTGLGVVHPPAGAHATIWADKNHNWGFYAIVVFCSVVSVIPATIINNMSMKRQYPTYWGYLPKWLYRKVFGDKED